MVSLPPGARVGATRGKMLKIDLQHVRSSRPWVQLTDSTLGGVDNSTPPAPVGATLRKKSCAAVATVCKIW